MHLTEIRTAVFDGGITRTDFDADGEVTGALWSPAEQQSPAGLLLIAPGGGQDVNAPAVVGRAGVYAANGFAVLALDNPGQGGRPLTGDAREALERMRAHRNSPELLAAAVADHNDAVARVVVPQWSAVLDVVGSQYEIANDDRVGFFGLSLGAVIGLSLIVSDTRVRAALLGLVGGSHLAATATAVRVPTQFLLQWDDQLVDRDAGLALFDALGGSDKTLHANPGDHMAVPRHELQASVHFFKRALQVVD